MNNEDEFNRSLDELLKQILAESETRENAAEDDDSEAFLDLITSGVDPDLQVCIQHEVSKAIRKMIPVLHRHVVTTVTNSLETYAEPVTEELRQGLAMYDRRVQEGTDQLHAEITKLQRTGRLLTWTVVVSWMSLLGLLTGGLHVYSIW